MMHGQKNIKLRTNSCAVTYEPRCYLALSAWCMSTDNTVLCVRGNKITLKQLGPTV
jgi:hypothetical protein